MANPIITNKDYRKIIVPRWVRQEVPSFPRPSRQELREQARYYEPLVEQFLPEDRGVSVLELGCGFGPFLYALKDRGYTRIRAIDLIPECCAYVREQVGVEAEPSDVFDFFANDEERYDVIAAFDVIEHLNKNEIVALMERLHDILSPGGMLIIRVPNASSLAGVSTRYSGFTHEAAFTATSIRELFNTMGFAVRCLPDPVQGRSRARKLVKGIARWAIERVISAGTLRMVPAEFAVSQNVTAIGHKR